MFIKNDDKREEGFSRNRAGRLWKNKRRKAKTRSECGFLVSGGERGIRTLDTLLTYTHFPGVRLQPLSHLSGIVWRNSSKRAYSRESLPLNQVLTGKKTSTALLLSSCQLFLLKLCWKVEHSVQRNESFMTQSFIHIDFVIVHTLCQAVVDGL